MPTATDYSQAIQNLRVTAGDEELKAGVPLANAMGLPLQYSGNFAVVFQVRCPQTQKTWAVKCFTKEVDRRAERYDAISQHLDQVKLPFIVGFQYQERGILVDGRWYPIVKMDWVEGEALNRFVAANLDKPGTLRQLLGLWRKLAERLRGAEVTHADLQHGNVLLVPAKDREGRRLMLVDYDGMHVPALALHPSGELGHPSYQHPERLRDEVYSAEVDRFSHLAIYCAIRCLMAGGRRLWERFDNGDNLLFRQSDFAKPDESEMLHRLWAARDEDLRALVGHLIHATQTPLEQVPWLPELVSDGQVRRLEPPVQERVIRVMGNRYSTQATSMDQQQPGVAGAVYAETADDAPPKGDSGFVDDMLAEWAAQDQQELQRAPAERSRSPHVGEAKALANGPSPGKKSCPNCNREVVVGMGICPHCHSYIAGLWENVAPGSPAIPTGQAPGWTSTSPQPIVVAREETAIDLGGGVRMTLVLIPAGDFIMGSPASDRDAQSDEKPQHRVWITKPFYLGKYEVTQQQWEAVMGSNPSYFKGPSNPVKSVSWDDCQDFLRKLNERDGGRAGTFRLPTEAEWEYACRAGSSTRWCFGDDEAELGEYGWYLANSASSTHPVGRKRPNGWGLYDVHGNVWEWCSDWYDSGYYRGSPGNDPAGPASGSGRVFRGGGWNDHAGDCRSACRYDYSPDYRYYDLGFRLASVLADK